MPNPGCSTSSIRKLRPGLCGSSTGSFTSGDRCLTLRKRIREQRRRVPEAERRVAERDAAKLLGQIGVVLRARRMGVYLSMDGELAVETATADAQRRNTLTCAPVIAVNGLRFAPLRRKTGLRENRLGVLEPTQGTYIDPRWLDVVLTPLVAFASTAASVPAGSEWR